MVMTHLYATFLSIFSFYKAPNKKKQLNVLIWKEKHVYISLFFPNSYYHLHLYIKMLLVNSKRMRFFSAFNYKRLQWELQIRRKHSVFSSSNKCVSLCETHIKRCQQTSGINSQVCRSSGLHWKHDCCFCIQKLPFKKLFLLLLFILCTHASGLDTRSTNT